MIAYKSVFWGQNHLQLTYPEFQIKTETKIVSLACYDITAMDDTAKEGLTQF